MSRNDPFSLPSLSRLVLRVIVEQYSQNMMVLCLVCLYNPRATNCHPTLVTQIHRATGCDEVSFGDLEPKNWRSRGLEPRRGCDPFNLWVFISSHASSGASIEGQVDRTSNPPPFSLFVESNDVLSPSSSSELGSEHMGLESETWVYWSACSRPRH